MEYVRSFVAIELPDEVKTRLAEWQERLKKRNFSFVKWVDPQSTHLTLKFLGNAAESQIPQIIEALKLAVGGVKPFQLEVTGAGLFPDARRPRVAWVGLGGDIAKLTELQQNVETTVSPLGFPEEQRGFTPHLTVVRVRDEALPPDRQKFGELVMSTPFQTVKGWEVKEINLMKSKLQPTGAVYTCLAKVELPLS